MDEWLGGILLGVGLIVGWVSREWWLGGRLERGVIKRQAEAEKFDVFAAEMGKIDLQLAASGALSDLDLLLRMEEKRYDEVSTLLVHKLGLFYHCWNSQPKNVARSEDIQNALIQIREAAKEFKSIEAVLTYKPNN